MLLKTFINKLELVPESTRHDSYEDKDILTFSKVDGFFPYIEFQSKPKDKVQAVYFDVLNWDFNPSERYVTSDPCQSQGFMKLFKLTAENALSVIDCINDRLHAFSMIVNSQQNIDS